MGCEDAGKTTITNKDDCHDAVAALNIPSTKPFADTNVDTYPEGCVVNLFPNPGTSEPVWNTPSDTSKNKGCLDMQLECLCKA